MYCVGWVSLPLLEKWSVLCWVGESAMVTIGEVECTVLGG